MRSYPGFKLLSQIFECRKVHIWGHRRGAKELYYSDKSVLIGSHFFWHTLLNFPFQPWKLAVVEMDFVVYIGIMIHLPVPDYFLELQVHGLNDRCD